MTLSGKYEGRLARLFVVALCALMLGGCASLGLEKQRSPEEQAAYDRIKLRETNMIRAEQQEVEAYLHDVAKRLYGEKKLEELDFRVALVSDPAPQAAVFPNGLLVWHVGTFDHLENEDEVAALIAHEVSHLTSKHHETDLSASVTDSLMGAGETVALFSGAGSAMELYLGTAGARWASNNVVFPSYSREQETEADLKAARTLAESGYNADALRTMLSKLRRYYGDQKEFVAKEVLKPGDEEDKAFAFKIDMDAAVSNLGGYIQNQWGQAYYSFTERERVVRTLLMEEFPERERGVFEAAPYQQLKETPDVAAWLSEHELGFEIMNKAVRRQGELDETKELVSRLRQAEHVSDAFIYDSLMQLSLTNDATEGARNAAAHMIQSNQALLDHYVIYGALEREDNNPEKALQAYDIADEALTDEVDGTLLPQMLAARDEADISHGWLVVRCFMDPSITTACMRR
ncbi:M48 family metallopeptidase [Halospina sp. K52047b]|uniref:M48 family metallopeptidase n=1 Tax=Halospina sp. K52047b TaxID=2614160 RepID=UPI0017888459|nr:M48 family metallopeptidase [Halospina sp. K52047b]